jgi:hypothetical protein
MTRDEILAADEAALKVAINAALKEDWTADQITHADLLDECEQRWGVSVNVTACAFKDWIAWPDAAEDNGVRTSLSGMVVVAPTRRLAELRALALALKAKGVLA